MLFWLHLCATGLYVGTTAGLALFTLPRAARISDPAQRRRTLAATLRIYDPLAIGLLGVLVMTGAWSVTAWKERLGEAYFDVFGKHLAWKLGLAFLVVMFGTYLAMGIGHRLVRQDEWEENVDEKKLGSMMSRLRGTAWATVGVTLATIWVAAGR